MSALPEPVGYCECDPVEVFGRPGINCQRCGLLRERVEELPVYREDANYLRRAARLLDAVICGDAELCAEDGLAHLAKVECAVLTALARVQHAQSVLIVELCEQRRNDNEEGRRATDMAGARDQRPGRQ